MANTGSNTINNCACNGFLTMLGAIREQEKPNNVQMKTTYIKTIEIMDNLLEKKKSYEG